MQEDSFYQWTLNIPDQAIRSKSTLGSFHPETDKGIKQLHTHWVHDLGIGGASMGRKPACVSQRTARYILTLVVNHI